MFDLNSNPYRKDFPIFANHSLVYLDNAATAQKPDCVIKAEQEFYEKHNANPLRGFYSLSTEATSLYENARRSVQKFINAREPEEIIFTRNTTEGLNLIAYSWALSNLKEGDEILVSIMEHHSNLLPWQMAAEKTKASLKYLECRPNGEIAGEQLEAAFSAKTKLVAVTHVSNVFGRTNPVKLIVSMAREIGALVVLDAAQSAAHMPVDVQELDVDFLAFSGHKLMGPMGIGVLYGKRELFEAMSPFLTGGEMIESVTRYGARFSELPHKFEAGTVNAAGAAGLAAAVRYIKEIGFEEINRREHELTALALTEMEKLPFVHVIGSKRPEEHCGILTFTVEGVHPHDVSAILDEDGIAVRAGHHCAQPLMDYLGISSTVRASLFFYNTGDEVMALIKSLKGIRRRMGYGE